MMLRAYQQRTVDDFFAGRRDNVCVVAPTGSGKTIIGADICSYYKSICWVAHRNELCAQAHAALDTLTPRGTARRVTTIQSLKDDHQANVDLLVLDECHHYTADDWSLVLNKVSHNRRLGLTATPERADGKGLCNAFDRLIVAATYSELLEQGHLVPCKITASPEEQSGLACRPLKAWLNHGNDGKTIAFAPNVKLAQQWQKEFVDAGILSNVILGTDSPEYRAEALHLFRAGIVKVLWNVYVLTEGFDVPDVDCVLLARKLGHSGQYLQCAGRGLRPAPGKDHMRMIDLAGNWLTHGSPTQDWSYSLEGKAIRRNKVQKLRQCLNCGTVCKAWVGECPECHYKAPASTIKYKIHNEELEQVFDGEHTPGEAKDDELIRLRLIQLEKGYKIGWVAREYKKLFGRNPVIRDATDTEVHDHYAALLSRGKWASWLCKQMCVKLFGRAP